MGESYTWLCQWFQACLHDIVGYNSYYAVGWGPSQRWADPCTVTANIVKHIDWHPKVWHLLYDHFMLDKCTNKREKIELFSGVRVLPYCYGYTANSHSIGIIKQARLTDIYFVGVRCILPDTRGYYYLNDIQNIAISQNNLQYFIVLKLTLLHLGAI